MRGFAQKYGLDIVNQVHPDFDDKSLYEALLGSFNSTATEVLGEKADVDEESFYLHNTRFGLGDVKSFDDFKKSGIKFLSKVGLAANTPQKMRFLEKWADNLIEKGVLPDSARKQH
ncbi:MAG: hypothetical protein GF334_10575 [Candidatus Altiarchaeales archaeon]|nr:hypothetical protein [Candidatus Altiarchaeales archaeon]